MKIKKAKLSDCSSLVDHDSKSFDKDNFPFSLWRDLLVVKKNKIFILWENKKIIGSYILEIFKKGEYGHLMSISIDPDHHGNGYGKQLLEHSIDQAKKKKCAGIYLEVRQSNQIAIKLYKKYGFRITHILDDFYDDEIGYRMELRLAEH